MILRKPYAFLIKHFKLLHLILVAPMIYLLFQTNVLMEFINEYTASPSVIVGGEYSETLFTAPMFILNFIIIIIALILIAVMYNKKKPFLYYIFTVVVYLALFVLYNYAYSMVGQMQSVLLDSRTTRALGDILLMAYLIQLFNVVQTLIRATGFDIKKFNFGEDLQELDISSEDNEEFEFDMKINTSAIATEFKKRFRFMRYVYVENKLIIDCIGLAIVAVITYFVYINIAANNKYFSQNAPFNAGKFTINVGDVFIVDQSYEGGLVNDDKVYVVMRASIMNRIRSDEKLNTSLMQLAIGDEVYYHSAKLRKNFSDLGNAYNNYDVPKEMTDYIFIYEIPYSKRYDKMYFRYLNNADAKGQLQNRYLKVKLTTEDLTVYNNAVNAGYGKSIVFDDSILLKSSLNINSIDVSDKFDAKYTFCLDENTCYDSVEIMRPEINTNYNKALVRIKGKLNLDKGIKTEGIDTLYSFLEKFATVEYVVDGKPYEERIISRVSPKKFNSSTLYIEVDEQILKASEIYLRIGIRNRSYIYKVK